MFYSINLTQRAHEARGQVLHMICKGKTTVQCHAQIFGKGYTGISSLPRKETGGIVILAKAAFVPNTRNLVFPGLINKLFEQRQAVTLLRSAFSLSTPMEMPLIEKDKSNFESSTYDSMLQLYISCLFH